MKNTSKLLLLLCCLLTLPATGTAGKPLRQSGITRGTVKHQGLEREYLLYMPDSLPDDAPLVIVLHGYGGDADPDRYGFETVADANRFAVCYPRGEKNGAGKRGWNVRYPSQHDMRTDDVAYMRRLARHLQKKYGLSRRNTFCTGMSNGGDIAYVLAYECPDVFAAFAPVAGLTFEWAYRELDAKRPVPICEIHGTADKTSMWEGDPEGTGGWGPYIGVEQAVGYWAAVARCTHVRTEEIAPRNPSNGHRIFLHRYLGGNDGVEVWLYEIEGGKHSWGEKDMDTAAVVWNFFSKYLTR